jgi:serine phosphatase RsbU (regulator of sigma subunit)
VASLPGSWRLELASRTAGGSAFGGDFVVSFADGDRWELALVDVSGKGVAAGTRALQLSGALGGLIGSVPPEQFLVKSNGYLLRQGWREGFATAAHLTLNVRTGAYAVRSAGHPPAARFGASNGEWVLADAEGPALGFLDDVSYAPTTGTLEPGDALLLYTDGLVEIPGRDLGLGIDKLLGEANRLVLRGFAGGAERLINAVAPGGTDDRAALLLWRT